MHLCAKQISINMTIICIGMHCCATCGLTIEFVTKLSSEDYVSVHW